MLDDGSWMLDVDGGWSRSKKWPWARTQRMESKSRWI